MYVFKTILQKYVDFLKKNDFLKMIFLMFLYTNIKNKF
jgi:hypothetical protein